MDWAPETKKQSGSGNNTCRNKLYTSLTHAHTHTRIYIYIYIIYVVIYIYIQAASKWVARRLEPVVGGGVVQVVDQALDSGTVWGGTAKFLDGKANVLVGAGTAADVAGGAGGDEQSLASNDLLLGQGGGLALVVDLRCPQVCL